MQTHHVLCRVVQHHAEIVIIQHPVQSCRQVLEQFGQFLWEAIAFATSSSVR